jgi:hypothetical protein
METNPYDYDTRAPWTPQQNQFYEGDYVAVRTAQQWPPVPQNQGVKQQGGVQKPKAPKPMPKARALSLARTLKKWLVATSLLGFLSFNGLIAFHQIGNTTSQSTATSSKTSQTTTATSSSSTSTSSQDSSGFFKQQGGSSIGSSSSSQQPVSGSSVS